MSKVAKPHHKLSYIPKQNKKMIYEYLFKEGVLVVEKNAKLPKHPHLDTPNLHVLMLMKSLKSRNYVDEKYNWKHQYFILNNEGIEYLREYLHLPPSVFPATLSKKTATRTPKVEDDITREHMRPTMGRGMGFNRSAMVE